MRVAVDTNTLDQPSTVEMLINGVAAGPSITIPATTTGNFADFSDSAISAGDRTSFRVNAGTSTVGSMSLTASVGIIPGF